MQHNSHHVKASYVIVEYAVDKSAYLASGQWEHMDTGVLPTISCNIVTALRLSG